MSDIRMMPAGDRAFLLERELPIDIPKELPLARLSRQYDDLPQMRVRLA
jgi:hypothetical protein